MQSPKTGKTSSLLLILAVLTLSSAVMAADTSEQVNTPNTGPQASHMTMSLGKVEVHGERDIYRVLQDIKVGLRQPYSTDPKLANVVVCRLLPQAGSHIMEHLICGTNRALAEQRFSVQTGMAVAESEQPACDPSCVMEHIFTKLNIYLQNIPNHSLRATVNGAALRTVLQKLPDPNSAAEIMQLGPLTIHGQADILQTLQAIKLALGQSRSNDPKLTDVVICRLRPIPGKKTDQMLDCATNGSMSGHASTSASSVSPAVSALVTAAATPMRITVLNSMLKHVAGNELHARVDGPALSALLKEIPYPATAPPSAPAPVAGPCQ